MAQKKNELDLPSNPKTWQDEVSGQDSDVSDIHTLNAVNSASKIHKGQFLSLRVLWKSFRAAELGPKKLGIESEHEHACKFLDKLNSWTKYLEDIRDIETTKATEFPDLGTFTLVRDHQLEVGQIRGEQADTSAAEFTPVANRTRSKTKGPGPQESPLLGKGKPSQNMSDLLERLDLDESHEESPEPAESPESAVNPSPISKEAAGVLYPPTRDEQIVNTALLLFLRAISIHKLRSPNWTLHRRIFQALFPSGKLEARTDGYLELISNGVSKAKAIVEVKPYIREGNEQVRMQESAQMVAWIFKEPDTTPTPKPRLLVAQDRQEIYVVIATYDNDYVSYLKGNKNQQGKTAQTSQAAPKMSFLRMEEYGPFNVENHSQMDTLGKFMLAVTMAAQ
ncbi:hypothetical protein FQN54_000543 [Arachnomyces sp. PD_36]|nr:hypothetical protein FQN54_000543 [Arachnomyces sp. PD_36]